MCYNLYEIIAEYPNPQKVKDLCNLLFEKFPRMFGNESSKIKSYVLNLCYNKTNMYGSTQVESRINFLMDPQRFEGGLKNDADNTHIKLIAKALVIFFTRKLKKSKNGNIMKSSDDSVKKNEDSAIELANTESDEDESDEFMPCENDFDNELLPAFINFFKRNESKILVDNPADLVVIHTACSDLTTPLGLENEESKLNNFIYAFKLYIILIKNKDRNEYENNLQVFLSKKIEQCIEKERSNSYSDILLNCFDKANRNKEFYLGSLEEILSQYGGDIEKGLHKQFLIIFHCMLAKRYAGKQIIFDQVCKQMKLYLKNHNSVCAELWGKLLEMQSSGGRSIKKELMKVKRELIIEYQTDEFLHDCQKEIVKLLGYQNTDVFLAVFALTKCINDNDQLDFINSEFFHDDCLQEGKFIAAQFYKRLHPYTETHMEKLIGIAKKKRDSLEAKQKIKEDLRFFNKLVYGLAQEIDKDFKNEVEKIKETSLGTNIAEIPYNKGDYYILALAVILFTRSDGIRRNVYGKEFYERKLSYSFSQVFPNANSRIIDKIVFTAWLLFDGKSFSEHEKRDIKTIFKYLAQQNEPCEVFSRLRDILPINKDLATDKEKMQNIYDILVILYGEQLVPAKTDVTLEVIASVFINLRNKLRDVHKRINARYGELELYAFTDNSTYLHEYFADVLKEIKKIFPLHYVGSAPKNNYLNAIENMIGMLEKKVVKFDDLQGSFLVMMRAHRDNKSLRHLWEEIRNTQLLTQSTLLSLFKGYLSEISSLYKLFGDMLREIQCKNLITDAIILLDGNANKNDLSLDYGSSHTTTRADLIEMIMLKVLLPIGEGEKSYNKNTLDDMKSLAKHFLRFYKTDKKYSKIFNDVVKFFDSNVDLDNIKPGGEKGGLLKFFKKKTLSIDKQKAKIVYFKLCLLKVFRDLILINDDEVSWLVDSAEMCTKFDNYIYVINMRVGLNDSESKKIRGYLVEKLLSNQPELTVGNAAYFLACGAEKGHYEKKTHAFYKRWICIDDILSQGVKMLQNRNKISYSDGTSWNNWKTFVLGEISSGFERCFSMNATQGVFNYSIMFAVFFTSLAKTLGRHSIEYDEEKNIFSLKNGKKDFLVKNMALAEKLLGKINIYEILEVEKDSCRDALLLLHFMALEKIVMNAEYKIIDTKSVTLNFLKK